MKKIMKRIILICIACIVLLLFVARVALYSISYHEKNDYREILSISYSGTEIWSGEETRIVCESEEEIKHIEKLIRKINFYPSSVEQFQESPNRFINIKYKDGREKQIAVSNVDAASLIRDADGNIIKGSTKFYYVNPSCFRWLFNK